jgi:hypothetical protein
MQNARTKRMIRDLIIMKNRIMCLNFIQGFKSFSQDLLGIHYGNKCILVNIPDVVLKQYQLSSVKRDENNRSFFSLVQP